MKTAQQQKVQEGILKDPRPTKIRAAALAEFDSQLWAAVREGFHQEPFLSVSDWAAQNRFLTGAESGRYNSLRCPYQRTIQDAFNDPEVREITWQSAERVGKSTVASNILGYVIDRQPADLLWVMPSREAMADFLKDEIEPMIRANPSLEKKIGLGRQPRQLGRTNNTRRKSFAGGTATFVGGASAAPLAFRTVKLVILDEVDKLRALPGEGDADSLASKRVSTYGTDFKILRFSKPTLEGSSRINQHFLRGSRAFYHIACPSCGEFQELGWALMRWVMAIRFNDSDSVRFVDEDPVVHEADVSSTQQKMMAQYLGHAQIVAGKMTGPRGERIRKILKIADRVGYPRNWDLWIYSSAAIWEFSNWRIQQADEETNPNSPRRKMTTATAGKLPFTGDTSFPSHIEWRIFPIRNLAMKCAKHVSIDDCDATMHNELKHTEEGIERGFDALLQRAKEVSSAPHSPWKPLDTPEKNLGPMAFKLFEHVTALTKNQDSLYSIWL